MSSGFFSCFPRLRNWQLTTACCRWNRNQQSCNFISIPGDHLLEKSPTRWFGMSIKVLDCFQLRQLSHDKLGNRDLCFPLPWGALLFVNKEMLDIVGEKEKNLWNKALFQQLQLLWILRPIITKTHKLFPKGVVLYIIPCNHKSGNQHVQIEIVHSAIRHSCYFFKIQPFNRKLFLNVLVV